MRADLGADLVAGAPCRSSGPLFRRIAVLVDEDDHVGVPYPLRRSDERNADYCLIAGGAGLPSPSLCCR